MTIVKNTQLKHSAKPKAPAIKDITDLSSHGIIFKDHNAMQEIFEQSGPHAKSCEFQVHYHSLVFRHRAADKSLLDIAIPLVYFNYAQEVSGARIDFEMKDVSSISDKLLPVAQSKANEIISSSFPIDLASIFGVAFTPIIVPLNSIHRHPGSSARQSFSGTDLDTSATDHGVVYPLATAEDDMPNFAGIMALDYGVNNVAHYEYRTVNGTLGKDITYTEGRCLAISIQNSTQSDIERLLNHSPSIPTKECDSIISPAVVSQLESAYKAIEFSPMTLPVRPENVTKRAYTYSPYIRSKSTYNWSQPSLFPQEPIKMYTRDELTKMSIETLKKILIEAEMYYYDTPAHETEFTPIDTTKTIIEDIMEIYLLIIDEQQTESTELDDIMDELISYGVAKTVLIGKDKATLEKWAQQAKGQ